MFLNLKRKNRMKISSTFHISVFLMIVLVCSMPFISLAQQNSVVEQAQRDAETDTNQSAWFCVGCASTILGGAAGWGVGSLGPQSFSGYHFGISDQQGYGCGIGMILGYFLILVVVADNYKIEPLPECLLGKSPEYVDFYTDVYKTRVQQLRGISATGGSVFAGCGVSSLLVYLLMDAIY